MALPNVIRPKGEPDAAEAVAARLDARLGYRFRDPRLLLLALTHKSYANENPEEAPADNERLEFLGDAVLDLLVSDLLYARFPGLAEGSLSKLRAGLVAETSLAPMAQALDLGAELRIGRGEEATGGRAKASLLSDAFEAVVAAIYLDSRSDRGLDAVREVIVRLVSPRLVQAAEGATAFDFKTELQEWAQKRYKEPVVYRIVAEGGPDHEKTFAAAALLRDRELGRGSGRSKKQAEQAAARAALAGLRQAEPGTGPRSGEEVRP